MILCDPTNFNSCIKTALFKAVEENNVVVFKRILENEPWPSNYPSLDYDLLVTAIRHGHKDITNILLDNGARAKCLNVNVNTPLHLAAAKSEDWLNIIKKLVKKGAAVGAKNSQGDTPLHIAFTNKAYGSIDLLLQYYLNQNVKNVVNADGLSFLHIACTRPYLEFVHKLLPSKNCQSALDSFVQGSGYTALHFAVEYKRHEIVEYLLKRKAKTYVQNVDQSTPVHFALKHRDTKLTDMLLAYDKQRCNIANKYNLSHFMVACTSSKLEVVKEYLEVSEKRYEILPGYLINAKINSLSDVEGYTALHLAANFGNVEIVEFLLLNGAHCCAMAAGGRTPHVLAEKRNYEGVIKVLRDHCAMVKRCREDYETRRMIEYGREIEYHKNVLFNLKVMNVTRNVSENVVNMDELWDSC